MSYIGLIGAYDISCAHTCLGYVKKQTTGVYITGIVIIDQEKALIMTQLPS